METRRDTSHVGDVSELEVALALLRAGRQVLRPLSSASRYDLLIDNGDGTFVRVQFKTGVLRGGSVVFRVCSVSGHRTTRIAYLGQVDAFGVFCPATATSYLVPTTAIPGRTDMVSLRVAAARNGQHRGIHSASEFAIG